MLLIKINLIGCGLALHVDEVAKIKNLLNTLQITSRYVGKKKKKRKKSYLGAINDLCISNALVKSVWFVSDEIRNYENQIGIQVL